MMMHRGFLHAVLLVAVAALTVGLSDQAGAADWGTLKGRFVYDGKPPEPPAINVDKDQAVCAKHKLLVEKLLVDSNGGLANALVYLREKNPAVSPAYEASAHDVVTLDNKDCHFIPHVVLLRTSQILDIKNSDPIGHNTKADFINNPSFNNLIPADNDMKLVDKDGKPILTKEEGLPMPFSCSIHTWMSGVILIRSNPYMAHSVVDGSWEIRDLPAGKELDFQFWHEAAGNLKGVAFKGGAADTKGRAKIMIKPGVNDLGDIKVPAKLLSK